MLSEIQSAYFGRSNAQITLHTGVFFTLGKKTAPESFCRISEVLEVVPISVPLRGIHT